MLFYTAVSKYIGCSVSSKPALHATKLQVVTRGQSGETHADGHRREWGLLLNLPGKSEPCGAESDHIFGRRPLQTSVLLPTDRRGVQAELSPSAAPGRRQRAPTESGYLHTPVLVEAGRAPAGKRPCHFWGVEHVVSGRERGCGRQPGQLRHRGEALRVCRRASRTQRLRTPASTPPKSRDPARLPGEANSWSHTPERPPRRSC